LGEFFQLQDNRLANSHEPRDGADHQNRCDKNPFSSKKRTPIVVPKPANLSTHAVTSQTSSQSRTDPPCARERSAAVATPRIEQGKKHKPCRLCQQGPRWQVRQYTSACKLRSCAGDDLVRPRRRLWADSKMRKPALMRAWLER